MASPASYPIWRQSTAYFVGDEVEFNNVLYRCIQGHTSLGNWQPPATPALWKRVMVIPQPDNPDSLYFVQGIVTQVDGTPCIGFIVKAVDVELRAEKDIGRPMITSSAGGYKIIYTLNELCQPSKTKADLKVYAYEHEGDTNAISVSNVMFDAAQSATINLIIGGTVLKAKPRFQLLKDRIAALAKDIPLADLTDEHGDISFIAGKLGETQEHIQHLAQAHQAETQTSISSDIWYGLFQQGLVPNVPGLVSQSRAVLKNGLEQAIRSNLVPTKTTVEIEDFLEKANEASIRFASTPSTSEPRFELGSLLKPVLNDPYKFIKSYATFKGSTSEFWKDLSKDPEYAGKIDDIKSVVRLGILSQNHPALVEKIQGVLQKRNTRDLSELTTLTHRDWVEMVNQPSVGAPPTARGITEARRVENYVKG